MSKEFVELLPAGATTPEGVKRVNQSLTKYEEATRAFASFAAMFIDKNEMALIEMVCTEAKAGDNTIKELWKELRKALHDSREAHDEFLRAVSGAPPRN